MNHNNSTTIIRRFAQGAWLRAGLVLVALATQIIAHGGFEHVIGTVVKVENNVLTVKTAKGDVDVELSEKNRDHQERSEGTGRRLETGDESRCGHPGG